jgi:anti-anti-sigma factor
MGQSRNVEQHTSTGATEPGEPAVAQHRDGDVVTLTVEGELSEAARRPLVRAMTDLLLEHAPLRRVRLQLAGVPFMNSAGLAVLVQLQKMAQPRGVELVLVAAPAAVVRPLQLSGLWHRFQLEGSAGS